MTLQEQLIEVEYMISELRQAGGRFTNRRLEALAAIALDLRGRIKMPPSAVLYEFERRMAAVSRPGNDRMSAVRGLGEETLSRWPVVRRALEKLGEEVEA